MNAQQVAPAELIPRAKSGGVEHKHERCFPLTSLMERKLG
jgi:hypothetical protein